MNKAQQEIEFAGAKLGQCRHVCAFFGSLDDRYSVLLPFIEDGVRRGDSVVLIANTADLSDHVRLLTGAGIDVAHLEDDGQLELREWSDEYLRDGLFNQEVMISRIVDLLERGANAATALTRLISHVVWPLPDGIEVSEFIEYEARLNTSLPDCNGVAICAYDLANIDAGTIIDILRTHPMVVIGGILQHNPFYVRPEEFLRQFRERASRA